MAVKQLSALAQETRLQTFRLLVQAGPAGLLAGRIAEELDVPATTLSFHLAQLRATSLATHERVGREWHYRANYELMDDLLAYLTENCCGTGVGAHLPAPTSCAQESVS